MTRVYARSHFLKTGDPPKVRAIYASPMTLQLIKMMISFPMVDHLMNKEHAFIARDYAVHTGGLHRLQREFNPFKTYISLDFLKFDKRMPFELIDQVRHLCRNLSDQGPYMTVILTILIHALTHSISWILFFQIWRIARCQIWAKI